MTPHRLRDAVASHATDYELGRELHAVRPHATHELVFEGQRAVCKLSTHPEGTAGLEGRILAAVGERTSVPVPEVLAVGDDHFVARWDDRVPQGRPRVTERRVRAMGRGLATLHDETADWFDSTGHLAVDDDGTLPGVELAHDADARWSDTLLELLDRRIRYLEDVGYGDVAHDVRDWFREHRHRVDGAGDPVLVHGNYLADHVGVGAGEEVTAVIDFEHALVGSAEWDYVRTALPTFGTRATHDVPESAFREAYESIRPLPAGFDDRRPVYVTLTTVSYLRSLHLQRGNLDSTHAVARRLRRMHGHLGVRLRDHRSDRVNDAQT